jgi:C-5 cytosine-specific DNA methylase
VEERESPTDRVSSLPAPRGKNRSEAKHLEKRNQAIKLKTVSKPPRKRPLSKQKKAGVSYSAERAARTKGPEIRRSKLRAADVSGPLRVREGVDAVTTPQQRLWTSIDLFCGAGGITEGFRRAGFECLYANDINQWATETFRANHPNTLADVSPIETVDARRLRRELGLAKGQVDVLVGGPPCQGFQSMRRRGSWTTLEIASFGSTCDFSTSFSPRHCYLRTCQECCH